MGSIPLVALMGTSTTHPTQPDNLLEDVGAAQQIGIRRQQAAQQAALQPGQLTQQGLNNQLGQQAVQSGALDLAQRQAVNDAWKAAATRNPDGTVQLDPDKLTQALALSGHGSAIPAISKGLLDMQEQKDKIAASKASLSNLEADTAGAGAQAVIAANGDPNVVSAFLQHMKDAGYQQEANQLQQHLQGLPPDQQMKTFQSLVAASPKQQQLAIEATAANARAQQANKPTAETLAVAAAGGDQKSKAALDVLQNEKGQITPAIKYQQEMENYRAALGRQASTANELGKQGIASLQKQSDTYSQFLNTSQSLKNSLQAATNGNEMAAAVAPLQGTLFITTAEGVKRINNTELGEVKGAGSLVQKINGELGNLKGTGPLSQELKDDTAKLVDIYTDTKYANYQKQAAYTQKLHGLDAKTTPILARDGSISGADQGGGAVKVTDPKGGVHTFPDQKSADAFKKAAGIQ